MQLNFCLIYILELNWKVSLRYYSRLLSLNIRRPLHCCYIGAFSRTDIGKRRKTRSLVIRTSYRLRRRLCCQGFLTIRACRRACDLTIRWLTSPHVSRSARGKNHERESRCETRLCGRFEGAPLYFYCAVKYAGLLYQKYVKWMYPFDSAWKIIQVKKRDRSPNLLDK